MLVTCPTTAVARRIGRELVAQRLAACVNVLPDLTSIFAWKGKTERCREVLLLIKTTAQRFAFLRRAVLTLHPYEVPEIIALPIIAGDSRYLAWVASSVTR